MSSALRRAGGTDLVKRAVTEPTVRTVEIPALLERAGLGDINPYSGDINEIAAAAYACRAAGAVALPFPIVGQLAGAQSALGLVLVSRTQPVVDHVDLMTGWQAVDRFGSRTDVVGAVESARTISAPFAGIAKTTTWSEGEISPVLVYLVLECWSVLGSLESALALSVQHAKDRVQFGSPLSRYQAIQFQIADAYVELGGLEVIVEQAVASYASHGAQSLTDIVAARVAMLEAAEKCLRVAHQIHGAVGFTDEHDLAWLSRHGHIARRSPLGVSGTLAWAAESIERHGFDGLFPVMGAGRE
ncbi:acyl-CoA dehydrogenase family protein [Aeromicrobium wangtongii]|uniref:Acyl-CoA dehydrogenase family protein n=1 Tax=Aeromicrobium wangtongii TaxID=2969247 RepID=A0ABY5MC12_9ACTN|nr:acyl-CoA dehydrogenase family protein [Aeromicrobium wangtongii]MCD9196954.1 hypothetical protein [Aeromicrobium wangtongii]UUP14459.1 acyl-CoA dehydrogenase family protein [Aeromicrobium wangtongii]